jgi:hypothetical protein
MADKSQVRMGEALRSLAPNRADPSGSAWRAQHVRRLQIVPFFAARPALRRMTIQTMPQTGIYVGFSILLEAPILPYCSRCMQANDKIASLPVIRA